MNQSSRYGAPQDAVLAKGWRLEQLTPPSQLFGANGMAAGPDGRLYIAQCVGSQISALNVDSGALEVISPRGGDIVAPDDLAFDDQGNMYVTEVWDARVSVIDPQGRTRVVRDDLPSANGITIHQNRIFVDECRSGGRLVELDPDGGDPRVLLADIAYPNALARGPDGYLYFPLIHANEIWRIHPDGGDAEKVIGGLNHPSAVKFDREGKIVSTLSPNGEVVRIDPGSGEVTLLARLDAALDNLAFVGDRLFVAHSVDGRVSEILAGGVTREVLPGGLHGPLDLAVGSDGLLYVADQIACYVFRPGQGLDCLGRLYDAHYPGAVRGLAPMPNRSFAATTATGRVLLYRPWEKEHDVLVEGLDQIYGIAVSPAGDLAVAERGTGRLLFIEHRKVETLAAGLADPIGVACAPDGGFLVSEAGSGRILRLTGTEQTTVLDGLIRPQGIAVSGDQLYVVDAGAQAVVQLDMKSGDRSTIASGLAIGAPPGVVPKQLRGSGALGELGPFAGIAAGPDGTLYVSADAEGSVIAIHPPARSGH